MKKIILFILMFIFTACTSTPPVQKSKVTCLQPSDEADVKLFLEKISTYIDNNETEKVLQHFKAENRYSSYDDLKNELSKESYALYLRQKNDKHDKYSMSLMKDDTIEGCYYYVLEHYHISDLNNSTTESNVFIYIKKDSSGIYISDTLIAG